MSASHHIGGVFYDVSSPYPTPRKWAIEESEMPAISRFYGIVIKIYYNDHGKPHFHAVYAEDSASIDIETLQVLDGYLPPMAGRMVLQWAEGVRTKLHDNWQLARDHKPLNPIAGLDE